MTYQPMSPRGRRLPAAVALGLTLTLALTACATDDGAPELTEAKQILANCQKKTKVAGSVAIDASGSSKADGLDANRLRAIGDLGSRVALCGGTLKVSAFTSSSATTVTLFEGRIPIVGATDTARARRTPKAVEKVLAEVEAAFPSAAKNLSGGGSDIVGQFRLAKEYANQLGDGYRLSLLVLTDGFQNEGINLTRAVRSIGGAERAASQFDVPDMSSTDVTVAGIGKIDGTAPPTKIVDGVKAFYETLCKRTRADTCMVVTDFTAGR